MRWYRFLPFFLTFLGVFAVAGALRDAPPRESAEAPALPGQLAALGDAPLCPKASAAVASLIDAVAARTAVPTRYGVTVASHAAGLAFAASGEYVGGAGRFRLELVVEGRSDRRPTLLAVCDGRDLVQATRLSDGRYLDATRLRLADVIRQLADGRDAESLGREFLRRSALRGAEQLLRDLRDRLHWVRLDTSSTEGVVLGSWTPATREAIAANGSAWPAGTPRLCRVGYDRATRWPTRVEWFAPVVAGGPDRLLTDVRFGPPTAADGVDERGFRIDGDASGIIDLTAPTAQAWKARQEGK